MPIIVPTTQESVDTSLTHLETNLNQDAPENKKAFLKVLSVLMGMQQTSHYKYGTEKAKQNLAMTATGIDLEIIGAENDVYKKQAEKWQGECILNGDEGVILPLATSCENRLTDKFYINTKEYTIPPSGNISNVKIQGDGYGPDWNVPTGEGVFIVPDIDGLNKFMIINAVTQIGTDAETEEEFRIRVLDALRTVGGGSNTADYRKWTQEESGVERGFPYTGVSPDFSQSIPGWRTVFVKSTAAVDPDGIAPQALLDSVRSRLNIDPETGLSRPTLGSVDAQLDVESISRTGFYFTVRGLIVHPDSEGAARIDIDAALDKYARGRTPFIWGLDPDIDKDDILNSAGASAAADQAANKYGGYISYVGVGKSSGQFMPPYQLAPGEFAKSIQVDYEAG